MAHSVEVNTPSEALPVERALAMARELEAVTDAAPDGRVPARAESVVLAVSSSARRRASS